MKTKKGFTMVELMMSIALLAIMLVIPILYTQASQVRFDFNTQVSVLVSYMRLAQSDSISGKDNSKHGIHLDPDAYVAFKGDTYNSADPSNYTVAIPDTMELRNIFLAGGGSDIVFDGVNGETLNYGTFDLFSEQIDKSITISVTRMGNINF